MFPTDIYGKHINSLPGNAVNVYKHVGGGQYELVYSKGTKIEHSLPYIAPISSYPNEKEVLIPRGMQYNITGVRTFKSPRTGSDLLFFTLKEIYKPK